MANNYPGNYNFVRDNLGVDPIANPCRFTECLVAMEKYSTPWWYEYRLNYAKLANMQIKEPVLLIQFAVFKKGVEKVIGRAVRDIELNIDNTTLIDEFNEKYQTYKSDDD